MAPPQAHLVTIASPASFGESGRSSDTTCFRMPRYLCCLPNGNLCISDSLNERLQIVTPDGALVKSLCEAGVSPGMLRGPSGLASDGSSVFVCEAGNHRVQKLRMSSAGKAGGGTAGAGERPSSGEVTTGQSDAAANESGPPASLPDLSADGSVADGASKELPFDGSPLGRAGHHGAKKPHE